MYNKHSALHNVDNTLHTLNCTLCPLGTLPDPGHCRLLAPDQPLHLAHGGNPGDFLLLETALHSLMAAAPYTP